MCVVALCAVHTAGASLVSGQPRLQERRTANTAPRDDPIGRPTHFTLDPVDGPFSAYVLNTYTSLSGGRTPTAGSGVWPTPVAVAEAGERTAATIREVPPAPSSLELVLSAFGTLGAWHLTRSARRLHLGSMPDWYHTGGPSQVGHAVPFSLEYVALPVCLFERPAAPKPVFDLLWEVAATCHAQGTPVTAAPRGPPMRSYSLA